MNNNFMKSSVKAVAAALVASLAFTSCSKDQFTEKDALNLELSRLRAQRTIDSIKTLQDRRDRNALLSYQRALDSLDRENAGGRVFYTVNVISATSSAVSNGRVEESEGVTGATVTTSQYGQVVSRTTQAGIATFELRSGEATVAVVAPAHTSADYTVNLTSPFSGGQTGNAGSGAAQTAGVATAPKNGTTVYVSNVVPLFQASTDGAVMATIRGRVFIETDLTNDVEELANTQNAAIQAAGTVANIFVSAGINSNNTTFFNRYLAKTGDYTTAGSNLGGTGGTANIGRITKLFYGAANATSGINAGSGATTGTVNRVPVGATGDYTILVPATVSGLPIVIKSDEILAQRTYFRDGNGYGVGAGTRVTERFMYGPHITPDAVPFGTTGLVFDVQAFTTAATATASYYPGSTSTTLTTGRYGYGTAAGAVAPTGTVMGALGTAGFAPFAGGLFTPTLTANYAGGYYGVVPTVTVTQGAATAPTTAATATAIMGGATGTGSTAAVSSVAAINLATAGAGYALNTSGADATASFNRTDLFTIGTANKVLTVGGTINPTLQVTDGGFGFNFTAPTTFDNTLIATATNQGMATPIVSGVGAFTGVLPAVNFTILPGQTAPVGVALPDLTTGTIAGINMTGIGANLSTIPASLGAVLTNQASGFVFGPNTSGALPDVSGGVNLVVSSAVAGVPQFNTTGGGTAAAGTTTITTPGAGNANVAAYQLPTASVVVTAGVGGDILLSANSITALTPRGAAALTGDGRYVFVPSASLVGRTITGATLVGTPATLAVSVSTTSPAGPFTSGGLVTSISMAGGNFGSVYNGTANAAPVLPTGITSIGLGFTTSTVPSGTSRTGNSLSANVFSSGTGIDNYVFNGQGGTAVTVTGTTPLSLANGTFNITTSIIGTDGVAPSTGAILSGTGAAGLGTGYLTANQAGNLLSTSRWLVLFETPTGAPNQPAWGVPVFSGNQLVSVRIVRPGAGYPVNATTGLGMMLVPNPFFTGTAVVAGGGAPLYNGAPSFTGAPVAIGTTNFDANYNILPNVNIRSLLPGAASIGIELSTNAAALAFTMTARGAGYTAAPQAVIIDGGLTFSQVATAINGGTGTNSTVTVTMAGNNAGEVSFIGSRTIPASVSTSATGAITAVTAGDGRGFAALTNTSVFTSPQVIIVDGLSANLTTALNTLAAGATNPFVITPAGGLTGIENNVLVPFVRIPATTLPGVNYNQIPRVTVAAPTGGTAATLVIPPLSPDPNVSGFGITTGTGTGSVTGGNAVISEIRRINITAAGSGYSFGNRYQRFFTFAAGTPTGTPTATAGQGYEIIGSGLSGGSPATGAAGVAGSSPQLAVGGSQFDVMTGVTYTRDIHYGTGRRID